MVDRVVREDPGEGNSEEMRMIETGTDKSTLAEGTISSCLEVFVSDTGIGIKPEDLTRIFKPFEQVDGSSSRKYQGTGLGLSLTKRLVELHGGIIWAESDGEGKGGKFTFVIPT